MTANPIAGPRRSFFTWAATYSFVAPLATAAVTLGTLYGISNLGYGPSNFILSSGFIIVITSLISGFVSLFGIQRPGPHVRVWKALLGILLSCVVGFGIILLAALVGMGHGC